MCSLVVICAVIILFLSTNTSVYQSVMSGTQRSTRKHALSPAFELKHDGNVNNTIQMLRSAFGATEAVTNHDKAIVSFLCGGSMTYWHFLENLVHVQSKWETVSSVSLYVCDQDHMSTCLQVASRLGNQLVCRLHTFGDTKIINTFKTAAMLQALISETAFHLLFVDLDMVFKRDVWKDVDPFLRFDMAFSNQKGDDKCLDINIGAVLVQRSRRAFEFWVRVYRLLATTGGWDQQIVSDLAWSPDAQMTFALFPRRIFYAYGFHYPVTRSNHAFDNVTALHAVCMIGKWLVMKEVGFWSDVNGYYSQTRTIRLSVESLGVRFDVHALAAFLAMSMKLASACNRKVILPDFVEIHGQNILRFYELWNIGNLEAVAPVLEPSFNFHAAPYRSTHAINMQVRFDLTDALIVNPPCENDALEWTVLADAASIARMNTSGWDALEAKQQARALHYCPDVESRHRIRCQPSTKHLLFCGRSKKQQAYPF
jgi:hypothetical protein